MPAYYNEHEPFAADWLRALIAEDLIAPGEVDERSIEEVSPDDLKSFTQCHLFAGIGGWSCALRLAGWPDDRSVWTGSCPCQPLSSAGQRKGHADERHLWPAFYRVIAECKPPVVFGEQVASTLGREWFAGIRADLEDLGHACGAADLCAASVGAPHIRQRIFWVAYADGGQSRQAGAGGLQRSGEHRFEPEDGSAGRGLGDTEGAGPQGQRRVSGAAPEGRGGFSRLSGEDLSFWSESVFIPCADGKARRVPATPSGQIEPALFPLADGLPGRVGMLRGAGNAIVPQLAAEFIQAAEEAWSAQARQGPGREAVRKL